MADDALTGPLILVADDEGEICDLLATLLADEGYRTATASDGIRALDLARHEQPDLILMDLSMPRLDAVGFCEAYRSEGGAAPIVLTSAGQRDAGAEAARACGAVAFLAKPFDIDHVLTIISACLGS
jgi:CheY-like chemotaxis protein